MRIVPSNTSQINRTLEINRIAAINRNSEINRISETSANLASADSEPGKNARIRAIFVYPSAAIQKIRG